MAAGGKPSALNKLITYGLMTAGIAILVGTRVSDALNGDDWTAAGLILFGLSCLTDPLLPGGTELTAQQVAMFRHLRIPYRDGAERYVSMFVGVGFLAGGLYYLLR